MAKHLITVVCFSLVLFYAQADLFEFPIPQPSGKDITSQVFRTPDNQELFPAAYGDFNADKLTDIITVNRNRNSINIFLAYKDSPYMRLGPKWDFNLTNSEIVGVTPGDFTGDGLMDFMVSLRKNQSYNTEIIDCYVETLELNSSDGSFINRTDQISVVELVFCIGNAVDIQCTKRLNPNVHFVQEPMVLDLNHDMILDFVGEIWQNLTVNSTTFRLNHTCNMTEKSMILTKQRMIWLSEEGKPGVSHREFELTNNKTDASDFEMIYSSSNAFVDLDGDLIPELILMTQNKTPIILNASKGLDSSKPEGLIYRREIYQIYGHVSKNKVKFNLTSVLEMDPKHSQVIGQPLFIDLERNGRLVHLIPFCSNIYCSTMTGIKAIINNVMIDLPLGSMSYDGIQWDFIPPSSNISDTKKNWSMENFYSAALTLRAGDYNLDGYPDLIGVLKTGHEPGQNRRTKAVIFENVPCIPTQGNKCELSRTFNPNFKFLEGYEHVISASFFDIQENGMADVLLVQQTSNATEVVQNQPFQISAFKNSPNFDSYFIKAMVLTGRVCPHCPERGIPYGSIIPGALINYKMKDQKGQDQTAVSAQMYRSAHLPMDLPYAIFGIGHSPNFVELLSISIGYNYQHNETRKYVHTSRQIIPNSHITIIPSPLSNPSRWKVILFLTPSDAVVHTFGVLIGILLVVGSIAAGLEYREKRQDRLVRMAEANRFMM